MPQVCVRLTKAMLGRLDALAAERGITRTRVVRQLLDAGLRSRSSPPVEALGEAELLELLSERARAGNVGAIRALLAREEMKDPRARALLVFERIAEERRQ